MATATDTPSIGGDFTDTDAEDVPVPTPSLAIDKTYKLLVDADGSGNVSLGDTIQYTITATNNGSLRS